MFFSETVPINVLSQIVLPEVYITYYTMSSKYYVVLNIYQ